MAVEVGLERLEEARATMLELFPEGFEEVDRPEGVELAAYTDAGGEERLWHFFGGARADDVAAGWEDRWRAFHQPVRVGSLWIGPPWEIPPANVLAVVVDPGRAFGTGSHATTQLCLQFIQELDRGSLLDVGCGSGVLSIAAALLGFAPVVGVDIEAPSIEATRENARVNGVEVDARLVAGDELLPPAVTAVANISLASVEALPHRLDAARLVTSGYLASEQPRLEGFRHVERRTLGGWASDLYELA
ncbi:MAG TPA: 50S ribosomal protein L11 methyltransferase [Gaiellaceae bacterium]|nr:50S ribosomal protein L11 methyltransferase [Gaiellaceae bacterium]